MPRPILTPSDERMREIAALRAKLADAESKLAEALQVIQAIQSGDVDAVVVSRPEGDQVFTLRGAEYAYRALVEAMNEGAATLGADGTVLYCNQRLSDLVGTPLEQIIGSGVANLVARDSKHDFDALIAQARNGKSCKSEVDFQPSNGNCIPVYVSLREMNAVEVPALSMVVTDLTERRKTDDLIAAGTLASSILESAAEAIAVCDETGKIIRANQALESLCGGNPLFQHFDLALPLQLQDDPSGPAKSFSIAHALNGGTLRAQEVHYRGGDKEPVPLLLTVAQIKATSGIVGCVLTMTDITERKRVEQAMLRSEKLASVGRLASTIAHEINNPLEAVGNLVYLALTDPGCSQAAKSYLGDAVQELERVNHITRQTLAFHRETSMPNLIDLRENIEGVVKLFAVRLHSRGVKVVKRYAEVARVLAFSGEIQQVISNLLSNSMDATPNHGRIEFRLSQISGDVCDKVSLTIADTGFGIPAEQIAKVFEPFFTTKEKYGTGLGLWVTKQIVEKHGATIRVRSKPGSGTVFSIVFPVPKVAKA
jgi:PAS domain S-box-containing protein